MKRVSSASQFALVAIVVFLFCLAAVKAGNDELKLQATLIWGTNGTKPKDPGLKDVEPETAKKLRGVFKWKNYYEVGRTNLTVAVGTGKMVTMSPKCEVSVQNLGKSKVAVELYGEGKMLVQKRQPITAGELLVLAGDDKNDTAWFVILNRIDR